MQRSSRVAACFVALSFLAVIGPGEPTFGASKEKDLRSVEQQIERERRRKKELEAKSRKLLLETANLRRELIEAAQGAQEKESLLTRLEDQLDRLVHDAKKREAALADQRRRLAGTLGALARLARSAPQAMLVYPGEPIDMVRSAMLLRVAVPQLGARAETLSEEVETLQRVKRDIAAKLLNLRGTNDALDEERQRLRQLLNRKTALRRKTEAAYRANAERMLALAAKAKSIRELVARIRKDSERSQPAENSEARRPQPPAPERETLLPDTLAVTPGGLRDFPASGPLTLPVRGRVVSRYGQSTNFGNVARGIRLETRPAAQVVAPFDGKVVFAGPFRAYGQILIIEHRGGYHTLLAGLAQIDAVVGQWLLAGEPLGSMAARKSDKPVLYVELRRNGHPINPLPWMTAEKQKVRG